MKKDCEFGCECDTIEEVKQVNVELDEHSVRQLIEGKVNRAQRYIDLRERLGGQFETD